MAGRRGQGAGRRAHSPRQGVHHEGDERHGSHHAAQVDGGDLVDFRVRRPLQVVVAVSAEHAEVGPAVRELGGRRAGVGRATATAMGTGR